MQYSVYYYYGRPSTMLAAGHNVLLLPFIFSPPNLRGPLADRHQTLPYIWWGRWNCKYWKMQVWKTEVRKIKVRVSRVRKCKYWKIEYGITVQLLEIRLQQWSYSGSNRYTSSCFSSHHMWRLSRCSTRKHCFRAMWTCNVLQTMCRDTCGS